MNWQKRDCPIKMTIKPGLPWWVDITMDIKGDHRIFSVCNAGSGDTFLDFPWCLYKLYFYPACIHTTSNVLPDEDSINLERALRTVAFKWEEDNRFEDWRIDAPVDLKADSLVSIDITEHQGVFEKDARIWKTSKSRYDVLFGDLCYAVGKAITEAMKTYGFTGLYESHVGEIPVGCLCFLKACGMGKPWFFGRIMDEEHMCGENTFFKDEMEVLDFDM